jgi:hypothetical protein
MYFVNGLYEASSVETQWGICGGRGVEAIKCSSHGHSDGHLIDTPTNGRS